MISKNVDILSVLEGDDTLIALLGGSNIYHTVATDASIFPRVTFFEIDNFDAEYADDTAYASQILLQIDVWSKGDPTAIAQEVDKTIKSIGFFRYYATDLFENDTKIFRKVLRYKIKIEGV